MTYYTGNKYYCPKCKVSFVVSDRLRVAIENKLYCPCCGRETAKFTSAFWFVEKQA